MKLRRARKQFWHFRIVQDFGGPVVVSIFMRSHMRKIRLENQHG